MATIQYAASDRVWKNYPCEVPPGTNFRTVYFEIEKIINQRPEFMYRVIWPQRKSLHVASSSR
jgi:hypothetical protein